VLVVALAAATTAFFVFRPKTGGGDVVASSGGANTGPATQPTPVRQEDRPPATERPDPSHPSQKASPEDETCREAIQAAERGHVGNAVNHYERGCARSGEAAKAKKAIKEAALKEAGRGCEGFQAAKAAAKIGIEQPMDLLRNLHCEKHLKGLKD
jgi:hypothetical protein